MVLCRRVLVALAMASLTPSCGDDSSPDGDSTSDASTTSSSSTSASTVQSGASSGSGGAGGAAGEGGRGGSDGGAGGGAPSVLSDVYRSGSRIRAKILDGGGDARAFVGWRDTELGVDCSLRSADGDVRRCLPEQGFLMFLDDACTQPAVLKTGTCGGEYASYFTNYVRTSNGCDVSGHYEAYRAVGDEMQVQQLYRFDPETGCYATGDGSVRPAEPVPLDAFVEGELSQEPIDDAMDRWTESYVDGAFRAAGGYDVTRDAYCRRMDPGPVDGTDWCVPDYELRTDNYQYWEDDSCGSPVVTTSICGEGSTTLILDRLYDECGVSGVELHERGTFFEGPLYETFGQNSDCFPQPSQRAVTFGPTVPYETFPALETRAFEGEGVVWRAPARSGRVIEVGYPQRFFNSAGARCYANTVDGDSARCVPEGAARVDRSALRYGDDACTAPLVPIGFGDLTCGVSPIAIEYGTEACNYDLMAAYAIGAPHVGAVYELNDAGTCVALDPGAAVYAPVDLEANILDELPLIVSRVE